MSNEVKRYDLIVIGAGSGGVALSRYVSTNFNKKVAVIEHKELGGTCVNVGCVPKKLMFSAANFIEESKHLMPKFGIETTINFDFAKFKEQRKAYILRLNDIYEGMLKNSNVDLYKGFGQFESPNNLKINDGITPNQVISGKDIMIATGSTPNLPNFPGKEYCNTSDAIFDIDTLPKQMLVVGGGYIGVEMAQIFCGYGVEVTLLVRSEVLRGMIDEDVREVWKHNARRLGLKVRYNVVPKSVVKKGDNSYTMELNDGSTIDSNFILYAAGREANIAQLNLDKSGVKLDSKGFIEVGTDQRTNMYNIYALGDVTARPQLTPLAIRTGRTWAENFYGGRKDCLTDFEIVPTVVFSHPPLGTVGLLEAEAIKKYGEDNLSIYKNSFFNLAECIDKDKAEREKSYIKLICVKKEQDRIVGVQMIGKGMDEIMQTVAVAVKMNARKRDLDATLAIHPTSAEELVLMQPSIWGNKELVNVRKETGTNYLNNISWMVLGGVATMLVFKYLKNSVLKTD